MIGKRNRIKQNLSIALKCLILRHPELKHLCGYVALSFNHPYYGKDYNDIDVSVHGGLTFAGTRDGDSRGKGFWWVGFDCAHFGDYSPGIGELLHREFREDEHYRNLEYVTNELKSLAFQLSQVELG